MPTQQTQLDEVDTLFKPIDHSDLLERQHTHILEAIQKTPGQEDAMESILGVNFAKFSPTQFNEISSQKTLTSDQEEL